MASVTSGPPSEGAENSILAPDLIVAPAATETNPSMKSKERDLRAHEYLSQDKFNRSLTLPATAAHDELTVTYAVGGVDSPDAPTLLFIGGMMGGRLMAAMADYIATKYSLRVIVSDR
jgi:hypothetical protein